jgi:hypothetical protein
MSFGLIAGFITQFYSSHYTSQFTVTSVLSHVAWYRLLTKDVPLLPNSPPCIVATISHQPHTVTAGFGRYFFQLLGPGLK